MNPRIAFVLIGLAVPGSVGTPSGRTPWQPQLSPPAFFATLLTSIPPEIPPPTGSPAADVFRRPAVCPAAAPKRGTTQPDQAKVAAKKEFGTIGSADPAVTKAREAKDLAGARKLIGKPGAFRGKVTEVYSPASHNITILDFAPNYREALTAVVKPDQYQKFPRLASLKGKEVLITGTFTTYQDTVQIELKDPAQVRVIR